MLTLLIILLAFAFIIVSIVKFEIHPFLALFVGAILYGLLAGMPGELIIQSISEGFGGVLGSIGLLILLGVIIGTFLEKTGGAFVDCAEDPGLDWGKVGDAGHDDHGLYFINPGVRR